MQLCGQCHSSLDLRELEAGNRGKRKASVPAFGQLLPHLGQGARPTSGAKLKLMRDLALAPGLHFPRLDFRNDAMASDHDVQDLIAQHTIRYEIWRHCDITEGKQVVNGFDLELHGTHDHGRSRLSPGCQHCWSTYEDLRRITEAVLPIEERLSGCEIPPFDSSLHLGPGRAGR